jgi:hypothetical protein
MKKFHLHRIKDISGVSGKGIIAEGCQFHDGQCVLSWFGKYHVIGVYPNMDDILAVHGHEGATELVWEE